MATLKEAQAKVRELSEKAIAITETKSLSFAQMKEVLKPIDLDLKHWESEVVALQHVEAMREQQAKAYGFSNGDMSGDFSEDHMQKTMKRPTTGAPNILPTNVQAMELFNAIKDGRSTRIQVKDTTTDPFTFAPQTRLPGITPVRHEPTRIAAFLPHTPVSGPLEVTTHLSTTGTAGMVGRGQLKPAVTFVLGREVIAPKKMAVMTTLDDETVADYPAFAGYMTNELAQLVADLENGQILNGDGTGENLLGLLQRSGILTRVFAADSETQGFDTVEMGITDLRNGAAKCEPNGLVLHPTTWSKLRRTKDLQDRYLVAPDPTSGEAKTLWGLPVMTTTTIAVGTGLLADFSTVTIYQREAFSIRTSNSNGDDFQRNKTSTIVEQRLNMGIDHPAALLKLTGL